MHPARSRIRVRAALAAAMLLVGRAELAAAPLTPGNILISDLDSGRVIEYTTAGVEVQKVYRGDSNIRDVVVGTRGEVHVFNAPMLWTIETPGEMPSQRVINGWSVNGSRTSRGGIGKLGKFVFVTDTDNGDWDRASGLVRLDLKSGSYTRVADGRDYHDLTIGGDGLLYGLQDNGWFVDVFDPLRMVELRSISLEFSLRSTGIRSIAVAADGTIYAAPWGRSEIYSVNQAGMRVGSMDMRGIGSFSDIDLDDAGRLLLGNWDGDVILTDVHFRSFSRFVTNHNPFVPNKMIHVAFTSPLNVVPEPTWPVLWGIVACALVMRVRRVRPFRR